MRRDQSPGSRRLNSKGRAVYLVGGLFFISYWINAAITAVAQYIVLMKREQYWH